MFINKENDNSVRDDEIADNPVKKKFSLFKKKEKTETVTDNSAPAQQPVDNTIDYNNKYLNNNKKSSGLKDLLKVLRTIICLR